MWKEKNNSLVREYKFADFVSAFAFLNKVAELSEIHQHHPTILNTYNFARLELNTHDEGGIVTDKDRELSADIDKIKV